MYKEMKAFEKAIEKIDAKIAELEAEKNALIREKAQCGREYNDIVISEAVGDAPADTKKMAKLKKRMEEIGKEIAVIEERIEAIQDRRREKLREYLPDLIEGYKREMDKARREILAKNDDLFRMKAEYLIFLSEIYKRRQEALRIHDRFKSLAAEVTDEYRNYRFSMPGTNLFNDYMDIPLGITERESKQALEYGHLPPSVMLYQATGEMVLKDSDAATKLRKLKAEGAK